MTDYSNIAERIDQLLYDWDPYEYHDMVDDREENVYHIQTNLENGDFGIKDIIEEIAECDYDDDLSQEAKDLLMYL